MVLAWHFILLLIIHHSAARHGGEITRASRRQIRGSDDSVFREGQERSGDLEVPVSYTFVLSCDGLLLFRLTLYCFVLECVVLCCDALRCIPCLVLFYAVLCCDWLFCDILHVLSYAVLWCIAWSLLCLLCYSVLYCDGRFCNILHGLYCATLYPLCCTGLNCVGLRWMALDALNGVVLCSRVLYVLCYYAV